MTKIKYRFKGHESFILREGWLNKGMREVRNDPFVFSQNYGADVLGVGPNMAKDPLLDANLRVIRRAGKTGCIPFKARRADLGI